MNNIFKQYNNRVLNDDGAYMSEDAKKFAKDFKRRLTFNAKKRGMEVANFSIGHYYISGFLKKNDKYVYFNYNIPRYYEEINFFDRNFLIRTAADEKDYHGGYNNFTNLMNFMDTAEKLLG
ncbi:MAG: hypothetical protein UIM53_05990 [Acutalibacteraceae bacterium]|nr:hypothetical protein [Acutalibacteraceae bacterium]